MRTGRIASVFAALSLAGCVKTTTDDCGSELCPANTRCLAIASLELETCVTDSQLGICGEAPDGSECKVGEVLGTCYSAACYPADCGDKIPDRTEACDDGNRIGGDLCSANCMSREVCGDGLIDPSLGEQCDDGSIGLSGDGCSSTCLKEYDLWTNRTPRDPGPRREHALARAPGGGVMFFGGVPGIYGNTNLDPQAAVAEAWRWDGTSWSEVVSATPPPSARSGATAWFDPMLHQYMLFGGRDTAGVALNDLWRWDGIAWNEVVIAGPRPAARFNASVACSPTRCALYGGIGVIGSLGDTWLWNGTWTEHAGVGPSPRAKAALAYDPSIGFVLFGGVNGATQLVDTWELTTAWVKKTTLSTPPASAQPVAAFDPTFSPALIFSPAPATILVTGPDLSTKFVTWYYRNGVWLNGGFEYTNSWPALVLDPDRGNVISVSEARNAQELTDAGWSTAKSSRQPSRAPPDLLAVYNPVRGRTLVIEPGATWEWDGRGARLISDTSPGPDGGSIVFDTACDRAVVFGGKSGPTSFSDHTWFYDGTWMRHTPSGPSARSLHAMAYDAKREVVVVFGGTSASRLGDLWELRGPCTTRTWTPVTAPSGPSPRTSARMAFDVARGVTVLFGGYDGQERDDTWEWDGTSWKALTPPQKPPARADHAMIYDARRGTVVLFGGLSGVSHLADTWEWDGTTWSRLMPIASPPGRRGMAVATDVTGGLVIFGGDDDELPGFLKDVWRLTSESNVNPPERCVFTDVDEDGDGLVTCDDPDCGARCAPLCPIGTSCTEGPRCGDDECAPVEDYVMCPSDCTAP